jgi:hypothetical protein
MRLVTSLGVLVTALVIVGCGGPTNSPRLALNKADTRRAVAINLGLRDMPAGSAVYGVQSKSKNPCRPAVYHDVTVTGHAVSPYFIIGHRTFADAAVNVLASLRDADAVFERDSGPALIRCDAEELRRSLATKYTEITVRASKTTGVLATGRYEIARLLATYLYGPNQGTWYSEGVLVEIPKRRVIGIVNVDRYGIPPSRAQELRFVRTMARRAG